MDHGEPSSRPHVLDAIRDRLLTLRDRLLMDPGFQRWAARFPLTKSVARRQAQASFDLCAGFIYSQVLFACVSLRVLERARYGAIVDKDLVEALGLPPARGQMLVNAAIALGLLERRSRGRIGLGMSGAAIVANPGISAMVKHHGVVYRDLADPVALLAGRVGSTALERFWPYADSANDPVCGEDAIQYSNLMSMSQVLISDDILDAYPLGQHRRMLDVGGGDGTFLRAVARRHPGLGLSLFDLPAVVQHASERLRELGMAGRIDLVGGDFRCDDLPIGYDFVSLVRVIHDHDDDRVLDILRRVRRAMEVGGTLLLAEPMSVGRCAARVTDVYFAFYLLAMGSGRPRTVEELSTLLRLSGFGNIRAPQSSRPMLVSVVIAEAI